MKFANLSAIVLLLNLYDSDKLFSEAIELGEDALS